MLRVIVIENDYIAQEKIVTLLGISDVLVVDSFSQVKGVVEKVLKLKPDVVFINMVISEIDGLTLGRKIRDGDDRIKIVFMADDGKYAAEAYRVGASDFLLKPLDEGRVAMAVERIKWLK